MKKKIRARQTPRDFVGYGPRPPHAAWPGGARIALNFSISFETGGERTLLEGDAVSEDVLTDIGFPSYPGVRSPMVETAFEYGPRVGIWRLLRIFERYGIKVGIVGVVRGLQQYPEAVRAFLAGGHEIVSHHWRWLDYHMIDEATEREHVRLAIAAIKKMTGKPPAGWLTGRPGPNTRRLIVEAGGVLYDRDLLGDELPYWVKVGARNHLVVPCSFETNDNRFDRNLGFSSADDFARYMIDSFDLLYDEGAETPKMMSVSLHDRIMGRPGRAAGLIRFLDHVSKRDRVWFCTGREIAAHWRRVHPAT